MGSDARGEMTRPFSGAQQSPEKWRDFGPATRAASDTETVPTQQAGLEGPQFAVLARAIQRDVLPRLMLVHRRQTEGRHAAPESIEPISAAEVQAFVNSLLNEPESSAQAVVAALQANGTTVEAIYLQLLAPSARRLGLLWEEDTCEFTHVTVGLGYLQRILNGLSPGLVYPTQPTSDALSILLLAAPGEQHTFGISMVSDFFRSAGWDVCGKPGANETQVLAMLGRRKFDALGFSLAAETHLDSLAHCIGLVRQASASCPPCIVVGGPVFSNHPEYLSRVGADLIVANGNEAPSAVQSFLAAIPVFS